MFADKEAIFTVDLELHHSDFKNGGWSTKKSSYKPITLASERRRDGVTLLKGFKEEAIFQNLQLVDVKKFMVDLKGYVPSESPKVVTKVLKGLTSCVYPYSTHEDVKIQGDSYKVKYLAETER